MKTDIQLARDIRAEFEADPACDSTGVLVEARGGLITLSGHVRSHAERSAVEAAANRVDEVSAIASDIAVLPQAA